MISREIKNMYSDRFETMKEKIESLEIAEELKKGLFDVNEQLFNYSLKLNANILKSKVSFYYVLNELRYGEREKICNVIKLMFKNYDLSYGNKKEIIVTEENPFRIMTEEFGQYDFWEIDFRGYKNEEFYDDFLALLKEICRDTIKCVFLFTDDNLINSSNNKIKNEKNTYKDCKYQYDYLFQITDKNVVYNELKNNFIKCGYNCDFNVEDITNVKDYRDNEIFIENALIKNNILKENNTLSFKDLKLNNSSINHLQLKDMIGLKNVKDEINNLEYLLKFYKEINKTNQAYLNVIFKGNPGTGKTTVARNYADLLYNLGYIDNNNLVEIVPTDLMGEYVGQTRDTTREILNKAKGGVLFIDEAYNLNTAKEYSGGTYMREAVVELLKYMEDKKNVVIYAGYKNEMEELLNINPGFKSRIGTVINFDDYTTKELVQIFKYNANKYNLKCSKKFIIELEKRFEKEKNKKNFGNARYVENLLNKVLNIHATNVYKKNKDLYLLTEEDLKIKEENYTKFGFTNSNE